MQPSAGFWHLQLYIARSSLLARNLKSCAILFDTDSLKLASSGRLRCRTCSFFPACKRQLGLRIFPFQTTPEAECWACWCLLGRLPYGHAVGAVVSCCLWRWLFFCALACLGDVKWCTACVQYTSVCSLVSILALVCVNMCACCWVSCGPWACMWCFCSLFEA
jgi:hypothetical protein